MGAIPHEFFKRVVREACGVRLPAAAEYAHMMAFLPKEPEQYHSAKGTIAKCARAWALTVLAQSGISARLSAAGCTDACPLLGGLQHVGAT